METLNKFVKFINAQRILYLCLIMSDFRLHVAVSIHFYEHYGILHKKNTEWKLQDAHQFKNVLKENMHITLVPNKSHNVHPKIQVNKWPIIQLQHNEALMHSEYSIYVQSCVFASFIHHYFIHK